jgi:hypothetical protein
MYRTSSVELFSAEGGKNNEDKFPVHSTALNELVPASASAGERGDPYPSHDAGQRLLPHLTFAKSGEARQHTKLRP